MQIFMTYENQVDAALFNFGLSCYGLFMGLTVNHKFREEKAPVIKAAMR